MKFYKITNSEEKHRDMKYQTGLNIDILPYYLLVRVWKYTTVQCVVENSKISKNSTWH